MDLGLISQLEAADQMGKSGNTSTIAVGCCSDDHEEEEEEEIRRTPASEVEKEHMFDKVVTPSDVGKLNRLVIPKQHAEKYFPLDAAVNEKGLLLNFEDARSGGNLWRFRYSYWNSSQSYVMTKGWSRFVKDKKLDAGDIVSFHRGRGDGARDRLFIDSRRRVDLPPPRLLPPSINSSSDPRQHSHHYFPLQRSVPWNPMLMRQPTPPYYGRGSVVYLGSAAPAMGIGVVEWPHQLVAQEPAIVFDSIPVVQGKAAGKRLRLFGVNMETAEQQALASPAAQCSSRQVVQCQYPNSSSNAERKGKSSMSLDLGI